MLEVDGCGVVDRGSYFPFSFSKSDILSFSLAPCFHVSSGAASVPRSQTPREHEDIAQSPTKHIKS